MNSAENSHILILTPQLPWPAHQGTSLRNLNIIRGLAERMQVTLLSYTADENAEFGPLADLCHEIVTVIEPQRSMTQRLWQLVSSRLPDMAHRLHSLAFDIALDQLLAENSYDVVQIEGIELARSIDIVREVSPKSRLIFDNHNAETELQRNALRTDSRNPRRWVAALYSAIQVRRLARFERWAMLEADATTAVSSEDVALLRPLAPQAKLVAIPNCIDTQVADAFEFDGEPLRFDLLFMGKMDYRPNIDAVLWFVDEIWPAIRSARPDTTLAVVGQKPHARLDRVRDAAGVTVTGWVAAVEPYVAGSTAMVMPLRVGSGTRLKLIQALAMGKPVVTTPLGVAGYPVRDGEEVLMGDNSAEFTAATLRLLSDPDLQAHLAMQGKQFAQKYDWRAVIPKFFDVYAKAE